MSSNVEKETWRVCRACMVAAPPHSMVSVFHVNISKKLMALCGVQVWPMDGLPKRICRECIVKLDISFQFKRQCERADQKLRQIQSQKLKQNEERQVQQIQRVVQPDLHLQVQSEMPPPQPLPLPPIPVESDELPLNESDNILTDLTHSVPLSLSHSIFGIMDPMDIVRTDKKNIYTCKICFKEFETHTKLSRHVYVHSGQKPFKCEVCKKAFSHNSNLKAHMKLHSDERPFVCTICQKGCKRSKDLEMHMRTHTGEKPHSCDNCGKAFSSSSNLIAHYRTHTGEKPYVCSVCQKAFCQSNELSKHKKIHAKEKCVCEICNKTFNGSAALIIHVMNHNDEKSQPSNVIKSYPS